MERMAYTGTKGCGCMVAIVVDEPSEKKDVAAAVKRFIESGYTVDHLPLESVRGKLRRCMHAMSGSVTPVSRSADHISADEQKERQGEVDFFEENH
jgi:hypothetical protein